MAQMFCPGKRRYLETMEYRLVKKMHLRMSMVMQVCTHIFNAIKFESVLICLLQQGLVP